MARLVSIILLLMIGVSASSPASARGDECQRFYGSWTFLSSGSTYNFGPNGVFSWQRPTNTTFSGPILWECKISNVFGIYWKDGSKCNVSISNIIGNKIFTEWGGYYCPLSVSGPQIFQRQ